MDEAHTYFVGDGQWLVHNVEVCQLPHPPLYRGTADPDQIKYYIESGHVMSDIALNSYVSSRNKGLSIAESLGIARIDSLNAMIRHGDMKAYAYSHHMNYAKGLASSFTTDRILASGFGGFALPPNEVGVVFTVNRPANLFLYDTRPIAVFENSEVLVFNMVKFDSYMNASDFYNQSLELMILGNKKP